MQPSHLYLKKDTAIFFPFGTCYLSQLSRKNISKALLQHGRICGILSGPQNSPLLVNPDKMISQPYVSKISPQLFFLIHTYYKVFSLCLLYILITQVYFGLAFICSFIHSFTCLTNIY